MPDLTSFKLESIITTIAVTDLIKASEFYSHLGFQRDWIWPDDSPTHASFSRDGASFMVVLADNEANIQRGDLYFRISGTADLHQYYRDNKIEVSGLNKTSYGMLDFSLTDPWGHQFSFGEPSGQYQ